MLDLVEVTVEVGGRTLTIRRPRDAEALLDEEAFAHEEFLPYWAELWPSGVALANAVAARPIAGLSVVELGCGLALPSLAAASAAARALATDWSPAAIALVRENAARNGIALAALRCSWAEPEQLAERGPFDLVLAADVLYERRNVDQLLAVLPQLVTDGEVLVADPGRPHLHTFLEGARAEWRVETTAAPTASSAALAIHALRRRARRPRGRRSPAPRSRPTPG